MAVLSDADRLSVDQQFQSEQSATRTASTLTKADIRAAVNAVDAWVDANAAAYNTAIPQPARGALTTKQKAELLSRVVRRRYEVA